MVAALPEVVALVAQQDRMRRKDVQPGRRAWLWEQEAAGSKSTYSNTNQAT